MNTVRAVIVALAFLCWGFVIALAWGAKWGTDDAGRIATVSSLFAVVYGSASYKKRGKGVKRKT